MPGLYLSDAGSRNLASLGKLGRAPQNIVGIGCKQLNPPFVQHALAPVLRISSELASQ